VERGSLLHHRREEEGKKMSVRTRTARFFCSIRQNRQEEKLTRLEGKRARGSVTSNGSSQESAQDSSFKGGGLATESEKENAEN